MPEDQSRSSEFLDGKQVELLAQYAMVAPLVEVTVDGPDAVMYMPGQNEPTPSK